MNSTSEAILACAQACALDAASIGPSELAESVDLGIGQVLTWLCSAAVHGTGETYHLFFCESPGEEDELVWTHHAEDLTLLDADGPFRSLLEAKRSTGISSCDWTESPC